MLGFGLESWGGLWGELCEGDGGGGAGKRGRV